MDAKRFKSFIRFVGLLLCLSTVTINAQILHDTISLNLIKKGVDEIYNFSFDSARTIFTKINQSYPGHPIEYLLKGMITFWENYPLISSSPARVSFENDMRKCIELCKTKHNPDDEAEYLLTNLCARGMLLLFYTNNNLSIEVFPLAISTYEYIISSFDFTSSYSDFFYFTGVYDYYRAVYPEVYPVYKSLAFLFPKGNRAKGLKELQTAASNSIFLKAESYCLLSGVSMTFEDSFQKAFFYSKSLHDLYPANLEYLAEYVKNLLLVKQYDEAEKLVLSSGTNISNSYFRAQLAIFNGIIQEKKYNDHNKAKEFYNNGIRGISFFGQYGNEYAAYAYFGLSRISETDGNKNLKKAYRKQAMEMADFKNIDFDE